VRFSDTLGEEPEVVLGLVYSGYALVPCSRNLFYKEILQRTEAQYILQMSHCCLPSYAFITASVSPSVTNHFALSAVRLALASWKISRPADPAV
jgi:hypothetical protein